MAKKNKKFDVLSHLQKTRDNVSESDLEECDNAVRALETLRGLFYGTPMEEDMTAWIGLIGGVQDAIRDVVDNTEEDGEDGE